MFMRNLLLCEVTRFDHGSTSSLFAAGHCVSYSSFSAISVSKWVKKQFNMGHS